jgi:hypothetical protein
VVVDDQAQRVDIYVDHEPDIRVFCPVCDTLYGLYDHALERVYWQQIGFEFGENGSGLSFSLESFVIRVAQEWSIKATARL